MAVQRNDPYLRSSFTVEIDGLATSGFVDVTPPGGEAAIVWYRVGNDASASARPMRGKVSLDVLTLRRGFDGRTELYDWWQQVRTGDPGARRDVTIILLDEARNEVAKWHVARAFPRSHRFERLDTASSEPVVEVLELVYEDYALG